MRRTIIFLPCAAALFLAGCSSVTGRLLADEPLARSEALEAAAKSDAGTKKKIVAGLRKVLRSGEPEKRAYAASALEDIGPAAADAVPELIPALNDADVNVAGSADRALRKLNAAAPALAAALDTGDLQLRAKLGAVLAAQGAAAVPALVKNFEKGKRELALWSAGVLGQLGPEAESAVPALARAAASSDAAVAAQASLALAAVGRPAGLWLAAALASQNPASRAGAARLLSALNPPPVEAAEALIGALEDADEKVREHAAMALASYPAGALAALPENFTPALLKAAAGNDAAAAWARTALAKTAPPAAPPPAGIPALIAALKSPDPEARTAAAAALGALGPAAAEAVPELWTAFKTRNCRQRASAAGALARIKPRLRKNPAVARALKKVCPGKKTSLLELPGLAGPGLRKTATGQLPEAP